MLRWPRQLVGTRLLRAAALLAGRPVTGKTALARSRSLDASGGDDRVVSWVVEEAAKRGAMLSLEDAERLVCIAKRPVGGYRRHAANDLCVILCHFNPAGFLRAPRLLYDTCASFAETGAEVIVAQVVMPDALPAALPDRCRSLIYQSDSVMFHKENLWNLAAGSTEKRKLFFVDGDVLFSRRDILAAVSSALDEFDVIQPFSTASWLSKEGDIERSRPSIAIALNRGLRPELSTYHPGFSWAMTREAFDRLGGFYERHPLGSGDTAFAFALTPGEPPWPKTPFHVFANTNSYRSYRLNAMAMAPRIGFIDGTVYHRWHGSWKNRRYEDRYQFLPPITDGEYPMSPRADGLLEWDDPAYGDSTLQYLIGRKEDE